MCFYYVPIGSKSSYPVQKFLLGAFLLGPKVPIGHVPIGLTDEFIGLKNSSQSAQFWFLLGAFLLGSPPVFSRDFYLANLCQYLLSLFFFKNACCFFILDLSFSDPEFSKITRMKNLWEIVKLLNQIEVNNDCQELAK